MKPDIWQLLKVELVEKLAPIASHGFTVGFGFHGAMPQEIVTTFSEDWLSEYQGNGYVVSDPVVVWGTKYDGIRSWNELRDELPTLDIDVVAIAQERGMPNGSVVSLTVNRIKTVLGITHLRPQLTEAEKRAIVELLSWISSQWSTPVSSDLTHKGKRFLELSAQGLTDQEIADQMHVSARAVYAMKARVLEKLNAKTIGQAVLIAYRSRIIDV